MPNKIIRLSSNIGSLLELEYFDLANTQLQNVWDSIGGLLELKRLYMLRIEINKNSSTIRSLVELNISIFKSCESKNELHKHV